MANHSAHADIEAKAVARVVELEEAEGRKAITLPDSTTVGVVSSPPRIIEVFAFAEEADSLELEAEQIDAALSDADFWVYVVEHAASADAQDMVVTRLGGETLRALMATRVEYRWAEIDWPGTDSFATASAEASEEPQGSADANADAAPTAEDAAEVASETADAADAVEEAAVVDVPAEVGAEAVDVPAQDEVVVDAAQDAPHAASEGEVAEDSEAAFDAEAHEPSEIDAEQQEATSHLERAFAAVGAAEGAAPQEQPQPKRSRWFF